MKKELIIRDDAHKDFYQEIQKYIRGDIDEVQFIKGSLYYAMVRKVYEHNFTGLTDESTIKEYVEAGAGIYQELDGLNRRLHIDYGGSLDEYLLYLITGQFFHYFADSETLSYEDYDSLMEKFKKRMNKSSHEPYDYRKDEKRPHVFLNSLIEGKEVRNKELAGKTGLGLEKLAALRSGRKKCTKDIFYMLVLAMNFTRHELEKVAALWKTDFKEERDLLIQSHMDNLIQLQNLPENEGKTAVKIINTLLTDAGMKPLSYTGRTRKKPDNVRTIFITGAMGFIGRNCMDYIMGKSQDDSHPYVYRICILSTERISNDNIPTGVAYYHGKLNDPLIYERILLENDVDYILHLAAVPIVAGARKNPGDAIDVNAQALSTLCNVILLNHIPIKGMIFPSTEHVYSGLKGELCEETVINGGMIETTYASSKFIAESIALSYAKEGLPILVTRLCNIYGAYDRHVDDRLIPKTIRLLSDGRAPLLYVDRRAGKGAKLDLLYAGDLAQIYLKMLLAFEDPSYHYDKNDNVYNLGSGQLHEIEEIQQIIKSLMKKEIPSEKVPGDLKESGLMSIDKARRVYGYDPATSLPDGLRRTIDWYASPLTN